MIPDDRIQLLLELYLQDRASESERRELLDIIDGRPDIDWYALLAPSFREDGADGTFTPEKWQPVLDAILQQEPLEQPAPRIRYLRRTWWAAAAAMLLIAGAATWLFTGRNAGPEPIQAIVTDIPAGGDHAVLRLANGQQITLDSVQGNIVQQGSLQVSNDSGAVSYQGKTAAPEYHTLYTRKGGQYRLRLPDGTLVWLNAASSITFPTYFDGDTRKVSITGEAYFEVAKNAVQPFIVQVNQMHITVLGTHFNINAYNDEPDAKTTLLEGAVRVTAGRYMAVLAPGQQARVAKDRPLTIVDDVNVEDVIAWKNGYTVFENADIATIMRQVARWYDVEVVFEGEMPARRFVGGISRNSSLQDVLRLLEFENVNLKIEGRKIIVKP
ncbi:FecR family protein [Chitinophaga sp. NPDC101104]|uniref:FecR family protein n=1 Tax=Chitinophaga sp. NPDC101104 TaxID=3390561 RepID=UPI003D022F58